MNAVCSECGKRAHRSYGAAMSAAYACSQRWDKPLRAYYSEACCCYHVSSHYRPEVVAA